jgi:hypothetical protein
MDQKAIVLDLTLKRMTAVEIHADLVTALETEAMCSGSVTHYLRSRRFTASIDPGQSKPPDVVLTESDKGILAALERQPFPSVRQLAQTIHLAPSTVYCPLTEKLGYTVQHLRWVPHVLSATGRHIRAQLSFQLFELLESQMRRSWHNTVTLNEFWFEFNTDHERIWLPQEITPPKTERQIIQSKRSW